MSCIWKISIVLPHESVPLTPIQSSFQGTVQNFHLSLDSTLPCHGDDSRMFWLQNTLCLHNSQRNCFIQKVFCSKRYENLSQNKILSPNQDLFEATFPMSSNIILALSSSLIHTIQSVLASPCCSLRILVMLFSWNTQGCNFFCLIYPYPKYSYWFFNSFISLIKIHFFRETFWLRCLKQHTNLLCFIFLVIIVTISTSFFCSFVDFYVSIYYLSVYQTIFHEADAFVCLV